MKVVITITGPSGSGKSTLESKLAADGSFGRIVSTTTRTPRVGEENGKNYFFVNKGDFLAMKDRGEFVETASMGENLYGASKAEFERCFAEGKPVIIVVEPNGRDQIKEVGTQLGWKVISVFLDNPPEVIATRLTTRLMSEVRAQDGVGPWQSFVKRLSLVIGIEPFWRLEAAQNDRNKKYDLIFNEFGPDNDRMVCALLMAIAYAYLQGNAVATEKMRDYLMAAYNLDKKLLTEKAA